jgi:N6-L-threonylcarbamoyladenine synthase
VPLLEKVVWVFIGYVRFFKIWSFGFFMKKFFIGIESTAHTFGVGVLNLGGEVLANERDQFVTKEGGMIPVEVRAHHRLVGEDVWRRALEKAGVGEEDVVGIGFSNAPGLAPCLLEGMSFVKRKAEELGVKVVEVNHCVAHLVVGEMFGARDAVMLYVSGANTQVIAFEGGRFRVFGETLDLGVGNFIDTIGRSMGLGFPAGAKIEELARDYEDKNELLELPYVVKGMDVSFSGIQTRVRDLLRKGESKDKLCYALQETVFAMLVEVAERALAHTGKKGLLLGGGVACNARLVEMCRVMCEERGCRLIVPSRNLLVDNGAMIGFLGLKMFDAGLGKSFGDVDIRPRERTDEVEVLW